AEHNRLRFDRASIERVLDSGNPELARLSDAVSAAYLARIERHNIEARVRAVLTQRLQHSEPTQEEVAEILNVSARTLQRKLGDSGTTFRKIVDESRHAQALAHFSMPQMSVNEVTHLLGFSCSSSFTRAFRRWTGLSPPECDAGALYRRASGARAGGRAPCMRRRGGHSDRSTSTVIPRAPPIPCRETASGSTHARQVRPGLPRLSPEWLTAADG